ncbi:MAG: sugar phosphate isomerase/epimerase [Planctomycetes bacterium]|nr:sugar phosphate isomerase/epimerase [Planctomycetota bacterium]
MKLSFSTLGCPDWSLEQIADNARTLGFDGVELRTHADGNHLSPDASPAEVARVAALFAARGAKIVSIKGYSTFAHVDDAKVAENQALLRKLVAIARGVGAKFVRTFAGQIPAGADHAAMTQRVADAIRPVAVEAAAQGVRIALEIHDDWCAGAAVMGLVQRIACPAGFGIVYDIHNAFHAKREPWQTTYATIKDHIAYCHLKDGYDAGDGKVHYVMLGAGDLPLNAILARFAADNFASYFSFEWEKKWHPEIESPERAFPHYVHKVRALWREVAARRAGA